MNVIVFGGSGFLGSHVADALAAAGHVVTVYDIRPSKWLNGNQRFVLGDILDEATVGRHVAGQEVVYNFAGLTDLDEAQSRPLDTIKLNVLGNTVLLEAARGAGIQRYVFASTIYVYGEAGGFYRCSKQACELYVEEYGRRYGLDYTILRYGTLYGRRADGRNSVHRYLRQALRDRRICAQGTGDELREYIHVNDAARLSVQVLAGEYRNENVVITGHHPMRFRDLLTMIQEIVGKDVAIELTQPPASPAPLAHYSLTPYSFQPKIGKKLVNHYYHDMGQGLIDCLAEVYQDLQGTDPPC